SEIVVRLTLAWLAFVAICDAAGYDEVAPIFERHCVQCHRAGGIGPMVLTTYLAARPWAKAIEQAVATRKMPPWVFDRESADPELGKFSNDPSLSAREIETVVAWAKAGAPEGVRLTRIEHREPPNPTPDAVISMPAPFSIPRMGEIDYQYVIVRTGF